MIGEDYRSLIELAFKKCDKFALVIQKDLFINDEWAMKFYHKKLGDIQSSLTEVATKFGFLLIYTKAIFYLIKNWIAMENLKIFLKDWVRKLSCFSKGL